MYEQAFNLNARPFTSMHYVKHYFPAKAINESLQTCQLAISRGSGPVVVIGDYGTGKTLLLAMLEEMFRQHFRVISLSADTIRSREDFLQNMLYQLQLNHRGLGENEMRLDIVDSLKKGQVGGVLLLIDNAQKMTPEAFEEIQPLLDFVHEGQPQVRLVLAGSQGVEDRLADNRLVTFNQRIASRCFLSNLSSEETQAYVRAHLDRSGGDPDALFSPEAWRAIYEVTEGRPRFINQVCDHAMIFSATRGVVPITDSLIREAWFDIQRLPGSAAPEGSGASISSTPVVTERIVSGEEGDEAWTVLEFGELTGESQTVETATAEVAMAKNAAAEVAPAEQTTQESPAPVEEASAPVATEPEESQVERDNAAIIASAIAGLGLAGAAGTAMAADSPAEESPVAPEAPYAPPAAETAETDAASASDPFNTYDFDNEEVLTDAYSPFVAEQNQRSLEVTSEQLQDLTPTDLTQESTPAPADSLPTGAVSEERQLAETFPTFESAMKSEPVRDPVPPSVEPRMPPPTRDVTETIGPNSFSQEFSVQQQASSEAPVEPETLPGSGYVPLDPDALLALQQAAPQAIGQQETSASEPAFSGDDEQDDEIRRQAEEIIQALDAGESVASHQGGGSEPSIQHETNAIEATIDQSLASAAVTPQQPAAPQVVMPVQETPQQPQVVDSPPTPEQPALLDVPIVNVDPVEPERRILADIREQVAFASESVADQEPVTPAEPPQSEAQTVASQQDDADILSVSHQEQMPTADPPEALPAWTEQEPSSGEASRVDYQKLFDQLRNHQNRSEG